ncbi:MAG: indole-3-glycerol-phosphate synthase [Archaeoglobaceae archaeon]|nr:indole-3-glycerol-phosphate synthase [Archaeoglobaceae archaeon]MDW8118877.1 indole-3-glycerol-phosphate synthase [Archaeoglobaceae archaeon]
MIVFGFIDKIKDKRKNVVIGEIKSFSPTKGDLLRGRNPLEILKVYERAGCSAISYITAKNFKGDLETLRKICKETELPVLRKDFIESKDEIERTAEVDAKALLLIARILKAKTFEFIDLCHEHGVEPVVEVFSEEDLRFVDGARVVLINNRDIFNPSEIDLERTFRLAPKIRVLKISGSGISSLEDLKVLKVVDAVLIGTAFMLAENTEQFVRSFVEARI